MNHAFPDPQKRFALVPRESIYWGQAVSRKQRKLLFTPQFELQLGALVGSIAKITKFPFLNMTFMTFQERACIL